MKILQFPLTKITIGFLFGIFLFRMVHFDLLFVEIGYIFCLLGLCICHLIIKKTNRYKYSFGIFVWLTSSLTGMATVMFHNEASNPTHYIHQLTESDKNYKLHLVSLEKIKATSKNIRFICAVKSLNNQKSVGKIILNISKTKNFTCDIGTNLIVTGTIFRNKKPFNPNVFDYGTYLDNQGIYAQVYTKKGEIKLGSYDPSILAFFSNFRNKIISNLELSKINKEELYVLNALVLGQQQDISTDILKDYQYAGAVHVLSVSGLHVGFIILFMTFLLKPIPNSQKGRLTKSIIVIASLWIFAITAGLSPSIVRSVTMFSFLTIGLYMRRAVVVYHTLLVSILLILLFKPSFLFDVGFQLSYLALFFIIWFQPVLAQIWKPKNKFFTYLWDIITVSFAAQIGTLPLSIYYFHQFPGLFFITNIIILPLIGIIMAIGVITIIIAICCPVPFYIAKPLEFLISFLNNIIHWIASLDDFVFRNISFSKEMLWSFYFVIIFFILWLKKPEFKRLSTVLISIIILQTVFIYQKKEIFNNEELIVFNSKKSNILSERKGNNVILYSNDTVLKSLNDNLLIQSYLVGNFCKIEHKKPLKNIMFFKHQKIALIDSSGIYSNKINPDIIIITQSPKLNLERLLKNVRPKQIVVDGTNFKSYAKLWEATCKKEKIPFHYTNEKGFYKL